MVRAAASAELGPAAKCRTEPFILGSYCSSTRGDTLVSAVLDSTYTVQSLSRAWPARDSLESYARLRDSLTHLWGIGQSCERSDDVDFRAGRGWSRPPLSVELRYGGEAGANRLHLTRRVSARPDCS